MYKMQINEMYATFIYNFMGNLKNTSSFTHKHARAHRLNFGSNVTTFSFTEIMNFS